MRSAGCPTDGEGSRCTPLPVSKAIQAHKDERNLGKIEVLGSNPKCSSMRRRCYVAHHFLSGGDD
jgi:hypothetical protein